MCSVLLDLDRNTKWRSHISTHPTDHQASRCVTSYVINLATTSAGMEMWWGTCQSIQGLGLETLTCLFVLSSYLHLGNRVLATIINLESFLKSRNNMCNWKLSGMTKSLSTLWRPEVGEATLTSPWSGIEVPHLGGSVQTLGTPTTVAGPVFSSSSPF